MVYGHVGAGAGGEVSCRCGMAMGVGVKGGGRRVDGGCGSKGRRTQTGMFVEDGGYLVRGELEFVSRVNGFAPSSSSSPCLSLAGF